MGEQAVIGDWLARQGHRHHTSPGRVARTYSARQRGIERPIVAKCNFLEFLPFLRGEGATPLTP